MMQLVIMVLQPIMGRIFLFLDQVSYPSLKFCRIEQVDESIHSRIEPIVLDVLHITLIITMSICLSILKLLRPFTYCLLSMIPSVDGFLI